MREPHRESRSRAFIAASGVGLRGARVLTKAVGQWTALSLTLWLLLSGCRASTNDSAPNGKLEDGQALREYLDTRGLAAFWKIQDQIALGRVVPDADWKALFATPAFQWQAPDDRVRGLIRERMQLAFQPDSAPLKEVIAGAEGYAATRWKHYSRMRELRMELELFLERLEESSIMRDSLILARQYMPSGSAKGMQWRTPVRLLLFGPDAIAGKDAIYVDLIEAYDQGADFQRLLAHEFHHLLYAFDSPLPALGEEQPRYWLVLALTQLHKEGLADRIDKRRAPLEPRAGGVPNYVEDFNAYYARAQETLTAFDRMLTKCMSAEDPAQVEREAWSLLHFNGHVEGFYMANRIAEVQGAEALLEDVGDPFSFLRRFDSVQPTFSKETLAWIAACEAELRAEQ